MNPVNILDVACAEGFRAWLAANHATQPECWVYVKRGKPAQPTNGPEADALAADDTFYYLDAVEVALCYGWIDSTVKPIDGRPMQRFSPRKPNSPFSELNKQRVRRLERLGLMTDAGRAVLPPMGPRSFRMDPDIETALKAARCWTAFKRFPPLYQRVRAYNVAFYKHRYPAAYQRALDNLIAHTKRGEMYGQWNDYGRLLED